ncbi:ATPase, T2SS/T4P/T4SS family [Candidatus Deferrimicrobium sp.]|uniref:ATPase, T2SS/T4P/T4SS family n=1 Tax=Candidatus Deferrimicrobium sp. TaxID=3060586 RepID=UPI002ED0FE1B
MAKKRLGEFLLETGLLGEEDLTRALAAQRTKRGKLGEVIVNLGLATEQEVAQVLSLQLGIPMIDLKNTPVEPQAIDLIQEKVARKHLIIPVAIDLRDLHIAMADPLSFEAFEDVRFASGYTIKPFIAPRSDVLWAIDQHYHLGSSLSTIVQDIVDERQVEVVHDSQDVEGKDLDDLRKKSEAAPVIRMVNLIVAGAVDQGASDIHVEPTKTDLQIRHRVDGLLRKTMDLPKWVQGAVVSRIKIMARMDIAEKRLPQDGRIGVRVGGRSLDLRVSTIPASYGEKVVIRILDSVNANIPLDLIGFSPGELATMEDIISRPQGIILITGPTGSGKTTTLYGILNRIKSVDHNITAIEDPIEYELAGINQVAVQEKIGLSFAVMLRSILRQDPDVIMLGEMRDLDTTTIAVQAALTGHLVLSTIHTNSSAATITRLRDLGVPSYMISSTIVGIVAQRLVRKICQKCKVKADPSERDILRLGIASNVPVYRGAGCSECGGTGYKGRTGIYEILTITRPIRDLIAGNATENEIRQAAISGGMGTLGRSALEKVTSGITTTDEVYRVVETDADFASACPQCATSMESDFVMCPSCGYSASAACPGCSRMISPKWKFCPYCRQDLLKPEARRNSA